ncbi:MAG: FAD-dependent oxidoreductase, partial [Thermomicrobiales bacterium]|nr:FAD-dependent oxidoreductase [Thermomicrobiales bacterium]
MANPALIAVDDDPEVLRTVQRDLRRAFGNDYRVLAADSPEVAIRTTEQLVEREEPVALFLVDQRMPGMTGVELLGRLRALVPDARRALLTAYADTDAAIRAINDVRLDHYLMKPWDPPEQELFPVIGDLLDSWRATYRKPFDGIKVIGNRWSPASHELRSFLARNQVPYFWADVEEYPDAARKCGFDPETAVLPIVRLQNGECIQAPTTQEVAAKIGLRVQPELRFYDLIVVGGGPAGLAGAVYGTSEGLSTALIEREAPGGQAGMSSRIENYLGFPSGVSGADLARRAVTQARRFGTELITPQEVVSLKIDGGYKQVTLADGSEIASHALLVASGVSYRSLHAPGLERLTGAGVYYGAATLDGENCRDGEVFIVGGANSAGQAAVFFSKYAGRVTMLVRGPSLAREMSRYLVDRIEQTPNIEVRTRVTVAGAHGDDHLDAVSIRDETTGEVETHPALGLFIFIGAAPRTDWLGSAVARDERGFVLSGPDLPAGSWPLERDPYLLEASVPGVFVAGDVRHGSVKRVASGVGEGSIAISFVHQYLAEVG